MDTVSCVITVDVCEMKIVSEAGEVFEVGDGGMI